ncbi:diguanylate cyclase [Pseudocolwellia sp. HL-MZ19]|uniref:diguanylate cyclase n=1 Tax=Pseudocolwellia sp. HL-MZ19 TaxID=3400846 RepID=UPI003CEAEB3D
MRLFLCIIFTFSFGTANSQEHSSQTSSKASSNKKLTEAELLKRAKSLTHADTLTSIKLANEALRLSKNNKNHSISAQSHTLLAKLAQRSKDIEQALHHFLQASLTYKSTNDKSNQIMSSIDYIQILIDEKRYEQANINIEELLPATLEHGDKFPIALTLIAKGDVLYKQKDFDDAIAQYNQATKYLLGYDKEVQDKLGETYKKIAQSYKRLKNRKQTAYFYKKTLDVYTNLGNKKLMARTLNTLAEAERYLGNLVIALEYSIRGLKIHEQLNDPIGRNKSLMGAGIIYRHIGRYEKSLEHIYEAHLYYKKMHDDSGIAKTSNQLGFIYTRLKQFTQARSFYQLTIELSDKKEDLNTRASALREIAVIDLNAGNYDSAMIMAKQAYDVYLLENDKSKASLTARVIANIYREQEDDVNAIVSYRESLKLATEIGSKIYQIKSQTALAGILIGIDNEEAISLLQKSVAQSIDIDDKSQALYAYRNLLLAEKSRGNFLEALRYAEEEIAVTQMIQNENNNNKLILAKASLHSHKLEIELKSLREKTKFDQLELVKKNNEIEITEQARTITELELIKNKYASIALALLLSVCVLLVGLIYRRFIASNKLNIELDLLAARDPLTNSYNRRILFDHMNRDFTNPELLEEYCIILADIDLFKNVNDTYGHSAGDSVLVGVSDILQSCVRQNDIVARFGGEEFCIILHRVTKEQALALAETMRKKVEKSRFDDIAVTCSFGVSSIEFNAKSPTELIDQADLALYKSKSLGRNQITLWEPNFTNNTNILEQD